MATQDPGSTAIKALTPATWDLFAGLVERHNGIFGGCWCVKFHPERADHVPGYDGNRAFKRCLVEEDIAHAALVVRDGEDGEEAIAWAEYGTPPSCPTSTTARSTSGSRTSSPTTGSPASSSTRGSASRVW